MDTKKPGQQQFTVKAHTSWQGVTAQLPKGLRLELRRGELLASLLRPMAETERRGADKSTPGAFGKGVVR